MNQKAHWDNVYSTQQPTEMSWHQSWSTRSLEVLAEVGAGPESLIIDVGGGDSTLVDALLDRHLGRVTVLDLSGVALARAQARLGARAPDVTWLEMDATRAELPAHAYDIWHDRALFHFLTEPEDRARYVATAATALRPGGILVVATFAPDGPTRCSGLDVARYSPDGLKQAFGNQFTHHRGYTDVHCTPTGSEQSYTYAVLHRR